jgi:5,10-methylenetetrahydromethanopterin reductase
MEVPQTRLGLAYVPTLPPERRRAVATAVEAAGLDELWVWEDCFKESAVATAAAALAWTNRITVGIGLMPVPLRNVALCAMEIAALERMFPGRLVAGVGHGVQAWMAQVGAKADSPLTLLEEYATALRRLLAGERVTVSGRYVRLDDVALDWPPRTPPPLMLGGTGPRSLALAARLGDGTLLAAGLSEEEVAATCDRIAEHRRSDHHPVVATQIAVTGPGAAARLTGEITKWVEHPAPGIGVAGDARQIADSVQRLRSVGITSVVIQPTADEPDLEGFVHFLGAEVKPLLDATL